MDKINTIPNLPGQTSLNVPVSPADSSTPGTLYTPPPTNISSGTLSNIPSITSPTDTSYSTNQLENFGAVTKALQPSISQYYQTLTAPEIITPEEKTQDATISRIEELLGQRIGKSEALAQEENRLKIPELATQYADLNSQIMTKMAEYERDLANLKTKPMSSSAFASYEQNLRAAKASEIGLLQARALGIQGQYETAKSLAQRAVDVKYAPIEEELTNKLQLLEIIKPSLDRAFANKAKAAELYLQDQKDKINQQREEEKQVQTLTLELAKNQAPQGLYQKALQSKDIAELLTIPGISKYLQSPLEKLQQIKLGQDIEKTNAELKEIMRISAAEGLSKQDREKILNNKNAQQAVARIGVIKSVEDYIDRFNEAVNNSPQGVLSRSKIAELKASLNTTVGSAINVAQGQGAMGDEEAKRILNGLSVSGIGKTRAKVRAAASGVINSQNTLFMNDLSAVESGIPGASKFQIFKDYLDTQQDDESLISGAIYEVKSDMSNSNFFGE